EGDPILETDRPSRHARDPVGTLPRADEVHVAGMEDGGGDYGLAPRNRSGRSGALRFFALPRRDDERLRVRPPARRRAMSAERNVPAPSSPNGPAAPRRSRGGALVAVAMAAFVAGAAGFAAGWMLSARRIVVAEKSPGGDAVAFV